MTKLTRSEFTKSMRDRSVDVSSAEAGSGARTALQRADLDNNGQVHGTQEVDRLFSEVDRLDRNGDANSIATQTPTGAPTEAGIAADRVRQLSVPKLKRGLANTERQRDLQDDLRRQEVPLENLSAPVRDVVARGDKNNDGRIAGPMEVAEAWRGIDAQDNNGDVHSVRAKDSDGNETLSGQAVRELRENARADPNAPEPGQFDVTWPVNETALETARTSNLGRQIPDGVARHREAYERASELTGVPASMIAAIHGNESTFGQNRSSSRGPESGFGLDDRFVSTSWGNARLREHGLGTWERGTGSARSVQQSAVIAAEHLKRQAATVGVAITDNMSPEQVAGAVTAYTSSNRLARRAVNNGTSWMFKPTDDNPLPRHPGGTSRTRRGTIRVRPSRKEHLLRWDTLIPLVQEQLNAGRARS